MWKLIVKALNNDLFKKDIRVYGEGKCWTAIKGFVWNFNDLFKLILRGAVYILLLAVIVFFICKLFSGAIALEMIF